MITQNDIEYFKEFDDLTLKTYQAECATTAIYDSQFNVLYPLIGLIGELGEFCNKFGKILRDNGGEITPELLTEAELELGDSFWMFMQLLTGLGLCSEKVAKINLAKLKSRKERGTLRGKGDFR